MRKSFTDIFQKYLEPIDIKYSNVYLEQYESDLYREVYSDIQVWGFMFPESIRSIMTPDSVKNIAPLVSAINNCRSDGHNSTNGKRKKMKNYLATGRGKYFDDMYNHLDQMIENHAAIRSMVEDNGERETIKYKGITDNTIKNYIEKNNDSVNIHRYDILRELSHQIRDHLDWFGDELMEAVMAKTKNTNLIKTAIALKLKYEDFDNALMKILELKHKGHFKQHLRKKYREGLIGIDDYSLAIL